MVDWTIYMQGPGRSTYVHWKDSKRPPIALLCSLLKGPRFHKGSPLSGSANCLPQGGTDSPQDSTNNLVLSVDSKSVPTWESSFNFPQFINYDMFEEKANIIYQQSLSINYMYPDIPHMDHVASVKAWNKVVRTESTFVPRPPDISQKVSHSYC